MTKTSTRILAAVTAGAALLALAGCVPIWGIPGAAAGPRVDEERSIEAVEAVVLQTSGDLTVVVGDTPSLRISAPENVLERLTSDIEGDALVLGLRGPGFGAWLGEIRYELTVPRLSEVTIEGSGDVRADFTGADDVRITIEGSGDVEATGIDAATVESVIDGSGEIDLAGTTERQTIEINGSGDVDADDLESRTARVEISGSGDVELHVTETLDAEISGSGELRHRGGAAVTGDVSGSGEIVAD